MFAARITTPIPQWVLVDFFRRSGQSDLRIEADDPVHRWVRSALDVNADQDVCVAKTQHINFRNLGQPDWYTQWGGGHAEVVKWNPHRNHRVCYVRDRAELNRGAAPGANDVVVESTAQVADVFADLCSCLSADLARDSCVA